MHIVMQCSALNVYSICQDQKDSATHLQDCTFLSESMCVCTILATGYSAAMCQCVNIVILNAEKSRKVDRWYQTTMHWGKLQCTETKDFIKLRQTTIHCYKRQKTTVHWDKVHKRSFLHKSAQRVHFPAHAVPRLDTLGKGQRSSVDFGGSFSF